MKRGDKECCLHRRQAITFFRRFSQHCYFESEIFRRRREWRLLSAISRVSLFSSRRSALHNIHRPAQFSISRLFFCVCRCHRNFSAKFLFWKHKKASSAVNKSEKRDCGDTCRWVGTELPPTLRIPDRQKTNKQHGEFQRNDSRYEKWHRTSGLKVDRVQSSRRRLQRLVSSKQTNSSSTSYSWLRGGECIALSAAPKISNTLSMSVRSSAAGRQSSEARSAVLKLKEIKASGCVLLTQ